MVDRYLIITTAAIERTELGADGNVSQITIAPGTIMNTVLWDGESDWNPGEGMQAVLESEYLPANPAKKLK